MFAFDNSNRLAAWSVTWGNPVPALEWDSTRDSRSNSALGSLKLTQNFTGQPLEFFAANGLFMDSSNRPVVLDGTRYLYVAVDLAVAPASAPSTNGDFGLVEIGAVKPNWTHVSAGSFALPLTATNWTRFVVPIWPWATNMVETAGLYVQVGSWFGSLTNTLTLNVDNLEFIGGYCCPPPPLAIERAIPGPGFWLHWPAPSQGYRLQASAGFETLDWHDTGLETNAVEINGRMRVLVPASAAATAGFWRLRPPQP